MIKNTAHVDFIDKNLDDVRIFKVKRHSCSLRTFNSKILCRQCFFYNVNESSLLRLDTNEKLKLNRKDFIVLDSFLTSPKTIIELPTE